MWPLQAAHDPHTWDHEDRLNCFPWVTKNKNEDMKAVEGVGVGIWIYIYETVK